MVNQPVVRFWGIVFVKWLVKKCYHFLNKAFTVSKGTTNRPQISAACLRKDRTVRDHAVSVIIDLSLFRGVLGF